MRKKGCTQYKTAASSKNRSRFIMHPTGRVKQGEINIRRLLHPKIGGKLFPCTQQIEKSPAVQGFSGKEKTLTFVSRSASFCGGELGIRTLGGLTLTAFRVLHLRPLGQLSMKWVSLIRIPIYYKANIGEMSSKTVTSARRCQQSPSNGG